MYTRTQSKPLLYLGFACAELLRGTRFAWTLRLHVCVSLVRFQRTTVEVVSFSLQKASKVRLHVLRSMSTALTLLCLQNVSNDRHLCQRCSVSHSRESTFRMSTLVKTDSIFWSRTARLGMTTLVEWMDYTLKSSYIYTHNM